MADPLSIPVTPAPEAAAPPSSPDGPADLRLVERDQATQRRSRFAVQSDTNALKQHSKPPEMLVEDFLEKRSLTMLCGSWSTGKTALLMATGMAVGLAEPLAGHFVAQPGRVLFLGFETSAYQYAKQYSRLLKGLGKTTANVDMVFGRGTDLGDANTYDDLLKVIANGEYDLVLLDGLKACCRADENSNTEMDPIMDKLLRIAELDKTVVFTHHTRKLLPDSPASKFDSRGASVISARCDVEWRVELNGHAMTLTCKKGRGAIEENTANRLWMDWDASRITLALDKQAPGLAAALEKDLQVAGASGLLFADLLSVATPLCPGNASKSAIEQRVKRALRSLTAQGKVSHAGQNMPYIWK